MGKPKTAIYSRVASTALVDSRKISLQEEALLRFAEGNGFGACVCFSDNGESGATLDRPAMKRLTAAIDEGEVDTVIVTDIHRIVSNYLLLDGWFEFLKNHNVRFIAVNDRLRIDGDGNCTY